MRTTASFLGAAASVMLLGSAPAIAMTAAGSTGIRAAIEMVNPVESVACWRYGWRGFGVYPGCVFRPGYAVAPPVYPAPVYAPPLVYAPVGRCWIEGRWRVC